MFSNNSNTSPQVVRDLFDRILMSEEPEAGLEALLGCGALAALLPELHALVGFAGMLAGAVLYALSYSWVETHIQQVAALGKIRLPQLTGIPDWCWFAILAGIAGTVFWLLETRYNKSGRTDLKNSRV